MAENQWVSLGLFHPEISGVTKLYTVVKVYLAQLPKAGVAMSFRGYDKPRLMGVASHLLSRWYKWSYGPLLITGFWGPTLQGEICDPSLDMKTPWVKTVERSY